MTEPADSEVLVKAKQLARDDGRLWLWSAEEKEPDDARKLISDDSLQVKYLNQALEMLRTRGRDLAGVPIDQNL